MRLVSWNVNGLRACVTKGFADTFRALDADIFCLQETKLQPGQITLDLPGYHQYWCSAEKRATPAPPSLRRPSRSTCSIILACRSTILRAA